MGKKLQFDPDYKSEYLIIGLSYHQINYRLSYFLNKKINIDIKRITDFEYFNIKQNKKTSFSLYYYEDVNNYITYYLIANRNREQILINSFKQTDYFLFVKGYNNLRYKSYFPKGKTSLINHIKEIPNLILAFEIDLPDIKNINNLISDLELHIIESNKRK